MVDYSKWDKLASELSDDDDSAQRKVQVTRLDPGTTVKIEANKPSYSTQSPKHVAQDEEQVSVSKPATVKSRYGLDYDKWNSLVAEVSSSESEREDDDTEYLAEQRNQAQDDKERETVANAPGKTGAVESHPSDVSAPAIASVSPPLPGSGDENIPTISSLTRNGLDHELFLWSQDKDTAQIRIRVPIGTKAKDVSVSLCEGRLVVELNKVTVLDKQLANAVWGTKSSATPTPPQGLLVSEQEEFDHEMEWELQDLDDSHRVVSVLLHKLAPSTLVRQWWEKVFVDDPKSVDLSTIHRSNPTASGIKMQKIWDDAHREFRKRVQNMKVTTIDCGEASESSNETDQ